MRLARLGTLSVLLSVILLAVGCSADKKEPKRLDREILGEELEFGRKAAEFELWQEAIFRWENVIDKDPENFQAINNLAVAYESVGDYEKAKAFYQNAIELNEDSAQIRKNYKRFLSFYKRHQQQLAREAAKTSGQSSSTDQDNSEGGRL